MHSKAGGPPFPFEFKQRGDADRAFQRDSVSCRGNQSNAKEV